MPASITPVLAWRNLWRHRRRTWLTLGGMIFCNVLLIFMISLQLSSYRMMIDNTLNTLPGYLQIQHRGYLDEQKMYQSVPEVTQLAERVREATGDQRVAARGLAFTLASSEQRSFGMQVMGVQPDYEPRVSSLPGLVDEGRYLRAGEREAIVLGAVLARNLKVSVGDEVTLLGSGRDGSMAAAIANVAGIFSTGMMELDRGVAQVPLGWFQEVFSMRGHGHSVVVSADGIGAVPALAATVRDMLPAGEDLVVHEWDELQPGLRQAITSDIVSALFIYSVLVLLVSLGLLNTQLMSVLERTREFGIMLALGMRPGRLARLVILESGLMALLGLLIGIVLGALLLWYLSQYGFTYPGLEEMGERFNLPPRLYPEVHWLALSAGPLFVFFSALVASLYPATRLFRFQPVEAMRAV